MVGTGGDRESSLITTTLEFIRTSGTTKKADVEYWDSRHRGLQPAEGAHSYRMGCEASFLAMCKLVTVVFVGDTRAVLS